MASLKENVSESGKSVTRAAGSEGGINFDDLTSTILTKFVAVIEAVIVLAITLFIVRWVKRYFTRIEIAHEQQKTALNVLEKILAGFVMVIGLTVALKIVGIDMSVLVGVGLLGISYGLKDIIKNYIAGILIFLKSPFKIGDIVKIKNFVGKIEKMEFQSTSIKTFDHRDITIYNSDIMAQSIENYSRYPMRRMEINVKLGYGSDIEKALKIFDKILENKASVLKNPKHSVVFKNFSDNSMIIQIKFWVNVPSNMLAIRSELAWEINQAFDGSSVFEPYVRGFETTSDFSLTPERQSKIKDFYNKPIFKVTSTAVVGTTAIPATTDTAGAAATAATPNPDGSVTPQLVPELVVDSDEPSIEEDL